MQPGDLVKVKYDRPGNLPLMRGDILKLILVRNDMALARGEGQDAYMYLKLDYLEPLVPNAMLPTMENIPKDESTTFYFKPNTLNNGHLGICWKNNKFPQGFGPFYTLSECLIHYTTANKAPDNVVEVDFRNKMKL